MAMAYYKLTRSQVALSLLASLLTLTPLFSSSIRPTYIYLIFNLLIIALGAEAGLLSSLLSNPNPNHNKDKPKILESAAKLDIDGRNRSSDEIRNKEPKTMERCTSEKVAATKKRVVQVRKCPSSPSIFFIGGGDCSSQVDQLQERDHHQRARLEIRDNNKQVEDEEEEDEDSVGGQELFAKAENFIGNFYKQLSMQREDSWKKIHGFYQISKLTE